MEKENITGIGKSFFWLFFVLGSICLLGFLLTKDENFAIGGFFLLCCGTAFNFLLVISYLIYGFFHKDKWEDCLKSIFILLINVPIAVFYSLIGLNML